MVFNDPTSSVRSWGRSATRCWPTWTRTTRVTRFESYDRRLLIRDIVEGGLRGRIQHAGCAAAGYGTPDEPALLTFYRDKRPSSRPAACSTPSSRAGERRAGGRAHPAGWRQHLPPSVNLRFLRDQRLLSLIETDRGVSKGPFYDTFHQLDMYFEQLTWKQGDPVVKSRQPAGQHPDPRQFRGFDYFKERRYMAMLGIDAVHPLVHQRLHEAER